MTIQTLAGLTVMRSCVRCREAGGDKDSRMGFGKVTTLVDWLVNKIERLLDVYQKEATLQQGQVSWRHCCAQLMLKLLKIPDYASELNLVSPDQCKYHSVI